MGKIEDFENSQEEIRRLDFNGYSIGSTSMVRAYKRRNSFGVCGDEIIHRICQEDYLDKDISDGYLTLPKASASIWNDPLENPLAEVQDLDLVTGSTIHLGALVSSFYALCWTHRSAPTSSDWFNFSHGKKAIRISTTVEKLMDRIMHPADPCYMHRAWLIGVSYQDPVIIQAMQNPQGVYERMDSQGARLALSAAVVRSKFSTEAEIRLLFDASIQPQLLDSIILSAPDLLRIPFDWNGFIDNRVCGP
jgi:hypothetical protein